MNENEVTELRQQLIDEVAKRKELEDRLAKLESEKNGDESKTGVFIGGVDDYYRDYIEQQRLEKLKKRGGSHV